MTCQDANGYRHSDNHLTGAEMGMLNYALENSNNTRLLKMISNYFKEGEGRVGPFREGLLLVKFC